MRAGRAVTHTRDSCLAIATDPPSGPSWFVRSGIARQLERSASHLQRHSEPAGAAKFGQRGASVDHVDHVDHVDLVDLVDHEGLLVDELHESPERIDTCTHDQLLVRFASDFADGFHCEDDVLGNASRAERGAGVRCVLDNVVQPTGRLRLETKLAQSCGDRSQVDSEVVPSLLVGLPTVGVPRKGSNALEI